MLIPKQAMVRSEKHRRFVASLPCLVSKVHGQTQCAHIRKGTSGGMGRKPSDEFCLPLSVAEHARQGEIGERLYWGDRLPDAIALAKRLYENTGNRDLCLWLMIGWVK